MIKNFSQYYYKNNEVRYIKNDKLVKPFIAKKKNSTTLRYKLKNDEEVWIGIAATTVEALAGNTLQLPSDALPIYNSNGQYFIDKAGTVYSFASDKRGIILQHQTGTSGYLYVNVFYEGTVKSVNIHKMVVETFILPNYTSKGLVCMHRDNNKTNCHIDNLCLGTYSQNNKDAYKDGLNPGNGLKKLSDE